MWYWIIPVIGAVALIVGIGRWNYASAKTTKTDSKKKIVKSVTNRTVSPLKAFSRSEIEQKLRNIAASPIPKDAYIEGAMCYEIAEGPDRAEYVCPTDGHKTIYNDYDASFIEDELPIIRNAVKQIKLLKVSLDEREYCKVCSPNVKDPNLYIVVDLGEASVPHRTQLYGIDDINLINQFLSGKKIFTDSYDFGVPMQDKMDRLQELLGIDVGYKSKKEE